MNMQLFATVRMTVKRGAFIVMEGLDRTGKSTQSKKIMESLNNLGLKTELMVFPDRTTHTGKLIDQYLSNKDYKLNDYAIHLLFSANRWENFDKMKKIIQQGVNLIVDRYSYSGIAFSAAKNMDLEWCKQPENGLLKPDLVFLLTLTEEEMQKRPGFGVERYEKISIQKCVKELYSKIAEDNWKIVDAKGTVEDVHEVLLKQVLDTIKQVETTPLTVFDFNAENKVEKSKENFKNHINVD